MAETYYSLTDIVKLCDNLIAAMPTSFYSGIWKVRNTLYRIPAADVVPVRHGKWKPHSKVETPVFHCSVCGGAALHAFGKQCKSDYCPNCGANMRDNTQKTSVDEEVKHG